MSSRSCAGIWLAMARKSPKLLVTPGGGGVCANATAAVHRRHRGGLPSSADERYITRQLYRQLTPAMTPSAA